MGLTTIYSCGNTMTSKELMLMVEAIDDAIIDVWYPELGFVNGMDIPLTGREIIAKKAQLKGKTIITHSELVIVMFLREIRVCNMKANELELWCGDNLVELAMNGEMLDPWADGFFEDGFNLRFT